MSEQKAQLQVLDQHRSDAEHGRRDDLGELSARWLLPARREAPSTGWRRALFQATNGLIDLGESPAVRRHREQLDRINAPIAGGHRRISILSVKGGVGKTTVTVGLGDILASLRGDRVIAVDANPDHGTLSERIPVAGGARATATLADLAHYAEHVRRYADVRFYTSQSPNRLEVLASPLDPAATSVFGDRDYRAVSQILERHYSICLTDCGTGLLSPSMTEVLSLTDQIVLVTSPSVDGARSAGTTLDWLEEHGRSDLVRRCVVVTSSASPASERAIELEHLEQYFIKRTRAVTRIPYDPHLGEGADIDADHLAPDTYQAFLRLAAEVAADFSGDGGFSGDAGGTAHAIPCAGLEARTAT